MSFITQESLAYFLLLQAESVFRALPPTMSCGWNHYKLLQHQLKSSDNTLDKKCLVKVISKHNSPIEENADQRSETGLGFVAHAQLIPWAARKKSSAKLWEPLT